MPRLWRAPQGSIRVRGYVILQQYRALWAPFLLLGILGLCAPVLQCGDLVARLCDGGETRPNPCTYPTASPQAAGSHPVSKVSPDCGFSTITRIRTGLAVPVSREPMHGGSVVRWISHCWGSWQCCRWWPSCFPRRPGSSGKLGRVAHQRGAKTTWVPQPLRFSKVRVLTFLPVELGPAC